MPCDPPAEYIARSVRQGMEEADLLPQLTAAVTRFDGMDYRSITSEAGGEEKELRRVDEGTEIPSTTVKVQENLVKLNKRGRGGDLRMAGKGRYLNFLSLQISACPRPGSWGGTAEELYRLTDIFVPNRHAAAKLAPFPEVERQAEYFLEQGVRNVIITLGHRGHAVNS